eukprot:366571-Chlamydomonas_euryale.AAC.23
MEAAEMHMQSELSVSRQTAHPYLVRWGVRGRRWPGYVRALKSTNEPPMDYTPSHLSECWGIPGLHLVDKNPLNLFILSPSRTARSLPRDPAAPGRLWPPHLPSQPKSPRNSPSALSISSVRKGRKRMTSPLGLGSVSSHSSSEHPLTAADGAGAGAATVACGGTCAHASVTSGQPQARRSGAPCGSPHGTRRVALGGGRQGCFRAWVGFRRSAAPQGRQLDIHAGAGRPKDALDRPHDDVRARPAWRRSRCMRVHEAGCFAPALGRSLGWRLLTKPRRHPGPARALPGVPMRTSRF